MNDSYVELNWGCHACTVGCHAYTVGMLPAEPYPFPWPSYSVEPVAEQYKNNQHGYCNAECAFLLQFHF